MTIRTKATLVKYLVVSSESVTNKREIKRLTGSTIADDLKFSQRDYYNWPSTLHHTLLKALAVRDNERRHRELKIYELDDNAYSTMYALKDDKFLAAVSISDDVNSRLETLLNVKSDIEHMNNMLVSLLPRQNQTIKTKLEMVGLSLKDYDKFEATIKSASDNYTQVEYQDVISEIKEIIKPSW